MPVQQSPKGGMVAANLFSPGGRFIPKPLSRVATVMQRLRAQKKPEQPLALARPIDPALYGFEGERLGAMKAAQRAEHDTHIDRALSEHPHSVLPTNRVLQAATHFGGAVKGGYHDAHRLMSDLLPNPHDAERWASINAILSANTPWLGHTEGATNALALWHLAGRPTDDEALDRLFGKTHRKGDKGPLGYVSDAPNVFGTGSHPQGLVPTHANHFATLGLAPQNYYADKAEKLKRLFKQGDNFRFDPRHIADGTFKTPNFAYAHFDENGVPIDTHMAKLLRLRKTDRAAKETVMDAQKRLVGKGPVTLAYKSLVSHAAREMGWQPRQVQEAAWAGVLSLMLAKRLGAKDYGEATKKLSQRAIRSGWDMHSVLSHRFMRQALHHLGADDKYEAAVAASRERHPVPGEEHPHVSDPAALATAFERVPSYIPAAAVPIQEALRLSRPFASRHLSPSFDALLNLVTHATFKGKRSRMDAPVQLARRVVVPMKELKPWQQSIAEMPDDRTRRSIFADWLEERGLHHGDDDLTRLRTHEGPLFVTRHPTSGKVVAVPGEKERVEAINEHRRRLGFTPLDPASTEIIQGPLGSQVVSRYQRHASDGISPLGETAASVGSINPNDPGALGWHTLWVSHRAARQEAHHRAFGS